MKKNEVYCKENCLFMHIFFSLRGAKILCRKFGDKKLKQDFIKPIAIKGCEEAGSNEYKSDNRIQ